MVPWRSTSALVQTRQTHTQSYPIVCLYCPVKGADLQPLISKRREEKRREEKRREEKRREEKKRRKRREEERREEAA